MSFASKHNKGVNLFTFDIPESYEFKTLEQLYKENPKAIHKVNLIYTNTKGKFGKQPVVATDSELVNLPHFMMEQIEEVYSDAESVALINNGHVGFTIYTYENEYGTNYAVSWVDID